MRITKPNTAAARVGVWLPIVLMVLVSAVGAADWSQWRGPGRDGVAEETQIPDEPPAELRRVWKVQVGEGHSSPVIVGGRVYLMARRGADEFCLALDAATGEEIWSHNYSAPYTSDSAARRHGLGPKATVTIDDGRFYGFGICEVLTCIDAESGQVLWQKRFEDDYGEPWPQFGASSSVLIDGDLCIAQVGVKGRGAIVAFDKKTGEKVWANTADGPAYASPSIGSLAGVRLIVTMTQSAVIGVRPSDGATLLKIPFKTPYEMNIVTPVVLGSRLIYSGYQQGVSAIALEWKNKDKPEAGYETKTLWHTQSHSMNMGHPVVHEGRLYFLSMMKKGVFVCLDLETGRAVWESPGRQGDYASVVLCGDRMLVLTNEGKLTLVPADPAGYKPLASWTVGETPTWAHLGVAGNRLFVKDLKHLACFEF